MTMRASMLVCVATLLSACAAGGDTPASGETASDRVYVTGSNIPKRASAPADANTPMGMGLRVQSREDLERMQGSGSGAPGKSDGLGL